LGDAAESPQKGDVIDAMLGAGIVNRVEASDRATDATHFEVDKNAHRSRVAPHHLVHQIVELDRHLFHSLCNYLANPVGRCLSERNLPDDSRRATANFTSGNSGQPLDKVR